MRLVQPIIISDSVLVSTNVSETLYTPYDAGFSYSVGDRVSVIDTSLGIHDVYESLVNTNIGNTPAISTAKWIYVSKTNPWLMFEQSVTSQTVNPESIDVSIQAVGRTPYLAALNVSAKSISVVMTDSIEGVVYDQTFSMISDSGVDDWYSFFFEPVVRLHDLVIPNLPLYASAIIDVTFSASGETAKCGALILGPTTYVGETQYGAGIGIEDYSVKQKDDFGVYTILERDFSKTANYTVQIDSVRVDTLHSLLASLRATPTLYIGADSYTSTAIYGFFSGFKIEIAYQKKSICSIEIEGLT